MSLETLNRLLTPNEIQELWLAHFDTKKPNIERFAYLIEDTILTLLDIKLSKKEIVKIKQAAGWE